MLGVPPRDDQIVDLLVLVYNKRIPRVTSRGDSSEP